MRFAQDAGAARATLACAVALYITLLAGACTTPRGVAHESVRPATSEAAIRQAADRWNAAFAARDVDAVARVFTEDVVALYPQSRWTIGRDANRAAWAAFYARPGATHVVTTDTVVAARSGELAYTIGRWRHAYGGEGQADVGGRYVATWRHEGDGWRIAVLSAHTHRPMPVMP